MSVPVLVGVLGGSALTFGALWAIDPLGARAVRMTAPPTDAEGDPFADIKAILPETTPVAQQGRDATARGQEYAYLILGPMGSQGPQYNVFLRFRHYAGWAPAWGEKAEAFKVAGTLEGAMGHIETWAGEN